jgi:hypothetical protein
MLFDLAPDVLPTVGAVSLPTHWTIGWSLVLAGFASGALLGLGFHRDGFAGGYSSFRRRIVRLGHVACVALGGMCVFVSQMPRADSSVADVAATAWLIGALAMPVVCFLSGWREPFRHLFFVPVSALVTAVVCTLMGGTP